MYPRIKNSLSVFEQKLAETLIVVEVVGKRGKKVPIILTPQTKESVDLLIELREQCGISRENPYIFARSKNALTHLRGHDCLNKMCIQADVECPNKINSTKLRKYMATVCQLFNLTENEHDWLARHLGHDIRVHREFYRMHESAVELTKVSRLLLAIDSGQAKNFFGKTLKDINVEDLPNIEEDDNDEEEKTEERDEIKAVEIKTQEFTKEKKQETTNETIANKDKLNKKKQKASTKGRLNDDYKDDQNGNGKNRVYTKPVPWTTEEKECVFRHFKMQIKNRIVPGKQECLNCIQKYSVLEGRDWTKIKFCVKNQITKISKM
ncbi:hypothetical protein FQR65_LT18709 [Abscondita terminalis]|nr:hypothetical protein FQR65_LT18709 [Abscondita terminalis]